ncbi:hypothetical protein LTR56_001909 [Elasticomyces elasticus]|nr:hypothetical protein LTR56_001909 [Elasticomyces elasticus]KAK3668740.1 hypothetical protein LTR22_000220 [Elasticomyces elasticus]KAK4930580.1 hypothetical protein LTR49_002994 [Elasticomyces elasticus]KAK5757899.1 hypothetical protein LTS12_011938 [Elasticomyces elasticus]
MPSFKSVLASAALCAVSASAAFSDDLQTCAAGLNGQIPVPTPPNWNFSGTIRRYYVAAEEVEWDYAPSGWDNWLGVPMNVSPRANMAGSNQYGTKWLKALYRGYTDSSFTTYSEQPAWQGIQGPTIRSEVGDLIEIMFVNKLSKNYATMHSMGLEYTQDNGEGADYYPTDTVNYTLPEAGAVPPLQKGVGPGGCVVYKWMVDDLAGPNNGEPARVHSYHSYVALQQDSNAGLIGPHIVYAQGQMAFTMANYREIPLLFMIYDESDSWLSGENKAALGGSSQSDGSQSGHPSWFKKRDAHGTGNQHRQSPPQGSHPGPPQGSHHGPPQGNQYGPPQGEKPETNTIRPPNGYQYPNTSSIISTFVTTICTALSPSSSETESSPPSLSVNDGSESLDNSNARPSNGYQYPNASSSSVSATARGTAPISSNSEVVSSPASLAGINPSGPDVGPSNGSQYSNPSSSGASATITGTAPQSSSSEAASPSPSFAGNDASNVGRFGIGDINNIWSGNYTVWHPQLVNLAGAGQWMEASSYFTMNGYVFANNPDYEMCLSDKVIWYVNAYGGASHVFHMHGNSFTYNGERHDAISLNDGVGKTLYMNATGVGKWQVICHVNWHQTLGMVSNYQVYNAGQCPLPALG